MSPSEPPPGRRRAGSTPHPPGAPRRPALRTRRAGRRPWGPPGRHAAPGQPARAASARSPPRALFLGVFGVVVFQALLVQGQARLDHSTARSPPSSRQAKQLHLQVAQLDSPERIVTYAHDHLHMVDPGDVVYLQQAPGDDARRPATTPAPAPATTAAPATTVAAHTTATTAKPTTPTTAAHADLPGHRHRDQPPVSTARDPSGPGRAGSWVPALTPRRSTSSRSVAARCRPRPVRRTRDPPVTSAGPPRAATSRSDHRAARRLAPAAARTVAARYAHRPGRRPRGPGRRTCGPARGPLDRIRPAASAREPRPSERATPRSRTRRRRPARTRPAATGPRGPSPRPTPGAGCWCCWPACSASSA